jgi:hypothetical protein
MNKQPKKSIPAKTKTITVKVDEENPQPMEILAQSIIELSDGVKKLLAGSLNRRALIILLNASSGVSKTEIHNILISIEELKKDFTNE